MNTFHRVSDHLVRLQRQLGRKVVIGQKRYTMRGYISNILSVEKSKTWEKELNFVFSDALKTEGYFIDIGMNLGQTLGKVLAIDPDRLYVGFEPQISACSLVDAFIKQNGLTNCTTIPIGLSNENGIKSFFSNGEADTMASLYDRVGAQRSSIQVRVGDEVIQELGIEAISTIKIDVEGAEAEVIEGLSKTIKEFKPQIVFEVLPNYQGVERTAVADGIATQRRKNAAAIMRLLKEHDYDVFQVHQDETKRRIETFALDDPSNFAGTNYVACPVL